MFLSFLSVGVSTLLCSKIPSVNGFSAKASATPELLQDRTVALPFLADQDISRTQHVFEYIVEYSELLEKADPGTTEVTENDKYITQNDETFHLACRIPCISEDIAVKFYVANGTEVENSGVKNCVVLKVSGASLRDFGLICTNLYGKRELYNKLLETSSLRQEVIDHLNREPPSPGFSAKNCAVNSEDDISQQKYLNSLIDASHLQQLEEIGYVVLETCSRQAPYSEDTERPPDQERPKSFATSQQNHKDLSQYLVERTGDDYRNDIVHFLTRPQATRAGLQDHYDMLLSIATYLNTNLSFRESEHNPISPATAKEPLTVPRIIQLAQYTQGDYYEAHSDNAYADDAKAPPASNIRQNYRHYTCILYCNDLTETDGGALRLYLQSREMSSTDAQETCQHVDIIPKNGRLLIFDSCMVHSVEEVTSPTKVRRALTLWILRPNDSGVSGELYF